MSETTLRALVKIMAARVSPADETESLALSPLVPIRITLGARGLHGS